RQRVRGARRQLRPSHRADGRGGPRPVGSLDALRVDRAGISPASDGQHRHVRFSLGRRAGVSRARGPVRELVAAVGRHPRGPPVIYEGAGAEMRRTLGAAVFSGMLGVTLFGIFLTPVFYYVIQWFKDSLAR